MTLLAQAWPSPEVPTATSGGWQLLGPVAACAARPRAQFCRAPRPRHCRAQSRPRPGPAVHAGGMGQVTSSPCRPIGTCRPPRGGTYGDDLRNWPDTLRTPPKRVAQRPAAGSPLCWERALSHRLPATFPAEVLFKLAAAVNPSRPAAWAASEPGQCWRGARVRLL